MIDFGPRSTAAGVPDEPDGSEVLRASSAPHVPGESWIAARGPVGAASVADAAADGLDAQAAQALQVTQAAQDVLVKLTKLAATFRSMPQSKLLGRLPDGGGRSRAEAGHALAGALAKAAQGIDERASSRPPLWRTVPYIGPFAIGDQLMVLGNEFVDALAGLEEAGTETGLSKQVWSAPDTRTSADQIFASLNEQIQTLMLS